MTWFEIYLRFGACACSCLCQPPLCPHPISSIHHYCCSLIALSIVVCGFVFNRKTFPQRLILFLLLFCSLHDQEILLYDILRFFFSCSTHLSICFVQCVRFKFDFDHLILFLWNVVAFSVPRERFKVQRLQFYNLFEISWKT